MNESGTYMESYELESDAAISSDSSEDDLIDQAAVFEAEYMHVRLSILLADYMGMVDAQPERASRRWQVKPDRKETDMYRDMLYTWPPLGAVEEDKNYKEVFRVDKQTFDMLHQEIQVRLSVVSSVEAASLCSPCCSNLWLLCRMSLPKMTASGKMSFPLERDLLSLFIGWQMEAITRQSQSFLVWPEAHYVLSCMKQFKCWMISYSTEWFNGHLTVSLSRLWWVWSMSISCHAVLEPLMDPAVQRCKIKGQVNSSSPHVACKGPAAATLQEVITSISKSQSC